MSNSDRLSAIVADVERRLSARVATVSEEELARRAQQSLQESPRRSLLKVIRGGRRQNRPRVIAEIKRGSPAAGELGTSVDAVERAQIYAAAGAAAISVVTEPDHFFGDVADLAAVRPVGLPVLRKDFIFTRYQLLESVIWGADVVLLIARILTARQMALLIRQAKELQLECLVEVNDEAEAVTAVEAGAELIGINNRDLRNFSVDPERTRRLLPLVGPHATVISASGMRRPEDVWQAHQLGIDACLVGEALMRAEDPAAWLQQVTGVDGSLLPRAQGGGSL